MIFIIVDTVWKISLHLISPLGRTEKEKLSRQALIYDTTRAIIERVRYIEKVRLWKKYFRIPSMAKEAFAIVACRCTIDLYDTPHK